MIFSINKPSGITSHDVVNIIRRKTGERKVGHAGTLDPFATGVLVVATGSDTKKLKYIVDKEKEYLATIEFGKSTDTYDVTGKTTENSQAWKLLDLNRVTNQLSNYFSGEIEQTPPIYSAKKIKGKKAYELARKGKKVILPPQKVLVKSIKIITWDPPELKLKIITGPGVYIRSIAHDLGQTLHCPAYLKALERTRVGEFTLIKSGPV